MVKVLKTVFVLAAFLVLLGTINGKKRKPKQRQPNIIFIMADDLGWNDVGFHNPKVRTPNIDWLAGQGIELTNYYTQHICSPTRSALLTGRYPSNNGLQQLVIQGNSPSCLPLELKTIPEIMRKRNYATKYVGKWHLGSCDAGCLPTNRGWGEFRGILGGDADYFTWETNGVVTRYINDQPSLDRLGTHQTLVESEDVRNMINNHNPNSPLFMIVSPTAPHTPLNVTDQMFNVHDFLNENDEEELGRRKYLGLVSALDDLVGVVIDALRGTGLLKNSVIVFTSDNGGTTTNIPIPGFEDFASNYPLRNGKFSFLEGGTKVPTIYYNSKLDKKFRGKKRDFLMHITDWLPTFAAVAGAPLSKKEQRDIDGVNQLSNLRSTYRQRNKYKVRQELLQGLSFFAGARDQTHECSNIDGAYRWKDWKLFYGDQVSVIPLQPGDTEWRVPTESPELPTITGDECLRTENGESVVRCLFNIADDPSETRNLYDENPLIVRRLLRKLRRADRDGVQNVYRPGQEASGLNTQPLGGVLVPRLGFCTPTVDFPLMPQPDVCLQNSF